MSRRMYAPRCGPRTLLAKTCKSCGEFKMAVHYHLRNDGYRAANCRPCQDEMSRQCHMKTNTESLEKATSHFEKWTASQVEQMWVLTDRGLSSREIAERLGRTEASIFNARAQNRRDESSDIRLCYLDSAGEVRVVGGPHRAAAKGSQARLARAAQELAELHRQLIFFVMTEDEDTDHWREVMGIGNPRTRRAEAGRRPGTGGHVARRGA